MDLFVIGLNHKLAPIELRERLAFRPEAVPAALGRVRAEMGLAEAVLLSTCNRVELYLGGTALQVPGFKFQVPSSGAGPAAPPESAAGNGPHLEPGTWNLELVRDRAIGFLAGYHGVDPAVLRGCVYAHADAAAARHLFAVAGSLDSLVVGEAQILGQVKDAYALAKEAGATGRILNLLFQRAFAAAKRIRTETAIGAGRISVASVAAEFAGRIFDDLRTKTVLLLGAGDTGKLTLEAFVQQGVRSPVLCSRSFDRAKALAARHGGVPVPLENLREWLPKADVVIAALAAEGFVVGPEAAREALRARGERPLLFLDLGVPRNVDPAVNGVENAFVYDVDDLDEVVRENRDEREREIDRCAPILNEETESFLGALHRLDIGPAVAAFREAAHAAARGELERMLADDPGLDLDRRAALSAMVERIVNKILHPPTQALRDGALNGERAEVLEAVRRLFQHKP